MAASGYEYSQQKYRFIAYYKDGEWSEGELSTNPILPIHEASTALHYGQQCFEGLKAFKTESGSIHIFRPDLNVERMQQSCERLLMPVVPKELFIKGCIETVKANIENVPDSDDGSSYYLRPLVIGIGENLGVKPSKDYMFVVFGAPVGSYFSDGFKPLKFCTTTSDRAASAGTGSVKVGGNYAASMLPHEEAVKKGYVDCIYLDPDSHTKIEEVGAANFFGITANNEIVTPKSNSILNSITKRSIMTIAEKELGLTVVERDCYADNLDEFIEAGACGTAAVITPISMIEHNGKEFHYTDDNVVGEKITKLFNILCDIYQGKNNDYSEWLVKVE